MSIEDDVTQLLLALATYEADPQDLEKGNYGFEGPELEQVARLNGRRLQDAVDVLSERKLIKHTRFVGDPVGLVNLTAQGRMEAEVLLASDVMVSDSNQTPDVPAHKLPRLDVEYGDKLGSGAFGTVWRAVDKLLERQIAVKFLTSTDEAFDEQSLIREARTLAKIKHPNLVDVYAAAYLRHPTTKLIAPAIIMEFIDGEQIEQWWKEKRESREVLNVVRGITAGLHAMHEADMLHDDVHSGNIMVMPGGHTKLIDWRYQDIAKKRSSAHLRDEVEHELRRAVDIIRKLLNMQGVDSKFFAALDGHDLKGWALVVEDVLKPPTGDGEAPPKKEEFDDSDIANILEDWVERETAKVTSPFPESSSLQSPVNIAELANELGLSHESTARFLPDVLKEAGWVIERSGARTMKVAPSRRLQAKINPLR